MAAVLTLLPPLLLVAGATLVWHPPKALVPRRNLIGPAAAGLALLCALALLAVLWPAGRSAGVSLSLFAWEGPPFSTAPVIFVDLSAALLLALTCVAALVAALGVPEEQAEALLPGALLVAGGSALFIIGASVPLGLVLGWLALDIALFLGSDVGRRGLLTAQLGLLLALAGLAAVPAEAGSWGTTTALDFQPLAQLFLLVAAMARMGLYPLSWSVPRTSALHPAVGAATRLAPTFAGALLVLRVTQASRAGSGLDALALAPALVAVLFGALLTWLAQDRGEALDWQTTCHAGLVLMAARLGGPPGQAIALLLVFDLALGRLALLASERLAVAPAANWVHRVARLCLGGVPGTLGFAGRWLLYRELLAGGVVGVLLAVAAAMVPAMVPLWVGPRPLPPTGRFARLLAGLGVLLVGTSVMLGLRLELFSPLLVRTAGTELPSPLGDLVASLANPLMRGSGLVLLSCVLVPPLVAGGLQLLRSGDAEDEESGRRRARRALRLTGALDGLAAGFLAIGERVQLSSGLVEGRRDMPWTLLAAVAVGIMAFSAGGATVPGIPPGPTVLGAIFLASAVAVAYLMLLASAPSLTLAALGAAYLLEVLLLVLLGEPAVIGAIKLVSGWLVVGILAIGVAQAPLDRRLGEAARRLRSVRGEGAGRIGRLVPALTLAAGVVIAYGIRSVTLTDALPEALLRPALALVIGGVLTVVVARRPLRVTGGVLLALVGFELVYARLDDGLVITGALASFQLLFAVVASYFVGGREERA